VSIHTGEPMENEDLYLKRECYLKPQFKPSVLEIVFNLLARVVFGGAAVVSISEYGT